MSTARRLAHRYKIQTTATHKSEKVKSATNPAMKMAMKIMYAATTWNTGSKTKG
jgi:hypothetical protein